MTISISSSLPRRPAIHFWLWPLVTVIAINWILVWTWRDMEAWRVMWLLAVAVFLTCKLVTLVEFVGTTPLSSRSSLAYVLAWPGLDARVFVGDARASSKPRRREWVWAIVKTAFGAAMFWGVARSLPIENELLIGWTGMIGLVFILHFGLLHLIALGWRVAGVPVEPIMDRPIAATSLAEFWGQRWNRAFRDFAHRFVFRPTAKRWGTLAATGMVFAFSGLAHEMVISLPARGGYGLPTLYFLLQGAGVLFEKSDWARRAGLGRGTVGWLFAFLITCGPAFWLFHPPFVRGVIVPMMHAWGAW